MQKEGEPFQSFVADLRILGNTCKYGTLKDELRQNSMRRRFFVRQEAAFERERANTRSRFRNRSPLRIIRQRKQRTLERGHSFQRRRPERQQRKNRLLKEKSKPDIHNCKNCGGDHALKQKSCPAFG